MWKPETIVSTVLFLCLAIVVGLMSYMKAFESSHIVVMVVWIFMWIIAYAWLRFEYMMELARQKKAEKEEDLDYCWSMTNEILSRMEGGRQLLWERGQGRQVDSRTFLDHANRPNFFYAFLAFTEGTHEMSVVYYNATKKNILKILPMPDNPNFWRDMFIGWKPYEKSTGQGYYPGNNRNRVNVTVGGDGNYPQPMGNMMPTPGYVEDSYDNMRGNNQQEEN